MSWFRSTTPHGDKQSHRHSILFAPEAMHGTHASLQARIELRAYVVFYHHVGGGKFYLLHCAISLFARWPPLQGRYS